MLALLNSVNLYSCVVKTHKVSFDRDMVLEDDSEIKIAVQSDISDNDDDEPTKAKLTFSVSAKAEAEDGSTVFESILEVEYFFNIMNLEAYRSMSDEEQLALCSNLAYLDVRRRLMVIFSNVGMTGMRIPLSLAKFKGDI